MRTPSLRTFALIVLALSTPCLAPPAHADWPAGVTLMGRPGTSWGLAEGYVMPGSAPGEFYALADANVAHTWWVQRFTSDAQSLYATDLAAPSTQTPGPSALGGLGFAPDGGGGFLQAYKQYYPANNRSSLRSAHVSAAGVLFPGAGQIGYAVDSSWARPTAVAAPGGGAWYAWSRAGVRVMRVDANGAELPNWPLRGWRVPGLGIPQSLGTGIWLAPDGAGGVFVSVADTAMFVQRVGPDTTVASGWPAAGLQLRVPGAAVFNDSRTTIVPSGDPWYFATWLEGGTPAEVKLQRFSRAGQVDPAWPRAGRHLRTATGDLASYSWMLRAFPDAAGGVTVTWVESAGDARHVTVWACRVLPDGSYAPGYESGAKELATVDLYLVRPATLGVAVCPGRAGGLFVGWVALLNAQTYEHGLRGRWFDVTGAPDPSPALYEADLGSDTPGVDEITALAAQPDGNGGAYVLLSEDVFVDPYSPSACGGRIAHVTQHSVLDAGPAPGAASLALAVSPNPSHGAFSARFALPDGAPARLELLDVSGRRVWSREVRGAGAHVLAIEPASPLVPGVYLARLARGGEQRVARVAVLR